MAMTRCGECGGMVSTEAYACPHCGYEPRRSCEGCVHYGWYDDEADTAHGFGCSVSCAPEGIACPGYKYDDDTGD